MLTTAIDIFLTPEAQQKAEEFAREQTEVWKAKQVFCNTLAVYAVHLYLKGIKIDSYLEQSNSWRSGQRAIFDVSDLVVANYGRLECRPLEPEADAIALPTFTEPNSRGYVVIRLPVSVSNSQTIPSIETVQLLGFVKPSAISERENIPLTALHPLEDFLDDLSSIESWERLCQQQDPIILSLRQILGEREAEFVDRLGEFSQTEDLDDRNDRAMRFLLANLKSLPKIPRERLPGSSPSIGLKELFDLVEQLWDKLGI
jgi:Protein of unknown function (DUF1822)